MPRVEIDIQPGDTLAQACQKVRNAYREAGALVLAFEHLNTLLPISSFCHFFHVELEGKVYVVVVSVKEWDENSTIEVLNVLLNLRLDPEPPGNWPLFRFHSAYPVSPVLLTLFGDEPASVFECRAALVVGYGVDVRPSQAYQLATVGVMLLRECFGMKSSLTDPEAEKAVVEAISRWFKAERFPEGGAPINSLVVLGFLYGESLRARLPYASRWVRLRDSPTWPVLVFGKAPEDRETALSGLRGEPDLVGQVAGGSFLASRRLSEAPRELSEDRAERPSAKRRSAGEPLHVVFNPVGTVLAAYRTNAPELVLESTSALKGKCEEVLGAPDEN